MSFSQIATSAFTNYYNRLNKLAEQRNVSLRVHSLPHWVLANSEKVKSA